MSTTRILSFSNLTSSSSQEKYSLLQLPPSILAQLDSNSNSQDDSLNLEIRGSSNDSAVLVTKDQSWQIRGVQNSNSLCLCFAKPRVDESNGFESMEEEGDGDEEEKLERIEIETVLHETLELQLVVPRIERIDELLKGWEYKGDELELELKERRLRGKGEGKNQDPITLDRLGSLLPASDFEIQQALTKRRIVALESDMTLRSIPTSYLYILLPAIIKILPQFDRELSGVDDQDSVKVAVELEDLLDTMDSVGDCRPDVARQILTWFNDSQAETNEGLYELKVRDLVKELGTVVLAQLGFTPQPFEAFMTKWREAADHFAPLCSTSLLSSTSIINRLSIPPSITYLPTSHLSSDPSTRFSELFSLRPKWLADEMIPFLDDLGVDKKKRDAMVMKFVRKIKGNDGRMVWSARNLWTAT